MREVGVHLQHQRGVGGQGAPEAGDVGGAEPFLVGAVEDADVLVLLGQPIGDLPGAVGGVVIDDEDVGGGWQLLTHRAEEGLDVLGLVVGRQDQPGGACGGLGHSPGCYSSSQRTPKERVAPGGYLAGVTNAEIAAALEELGTLYERDGADRYRVRAYRTAARAIRDHPGSVAELAAAGRVKEIPGIGKTLEEKICTLLKTGDIPSAAKLRGKLPAATAELDSFLAENPAEGLVELSDIRGDLHTHTTLSDGRNTLEEMAQAAQARGYAYMAITDHSASHGFGDNVTAERLRERIEEIGEWNEGRRGFRLLAGSEVNIGLDGSLDYPEDLLAAARLGDRQRPHLLLDLRGADDGADRRGDREPHVDCIGHLTGRLIGRREPYAVDVEAVVAAAAETATMLEINGNPSRRDLREEHARLAAEAGVMIVLNTDAHGIETLDNMNYAVIVARGAGLASRIESPTREAGGSSRGFSGGRDAYAGRARSDRFAVLGCGRALSDGRLSWGPRRT